MQDFNPAGVREGVLAEVGACLAEQPCEVLATDTATDVCFYEVSAATAMTAPTQVLIDQCEGRAQRYFECNIWWSVDDCLAGMAFWSDDVLIEAGACLREKCSGLEECETAVFEKYQ